MANDSPAKSLVDIDLASLRVSAAPNRADVSFFVFFFRLHLFHVRSVRTHGPTDDSDFKTASDEMLVVARAESIGREEGGKK